MNCFKTYTAPLGNGDAGKWGANEKRNKELAMSGKEH
jgi:hypothetical protein